VLATAACLEIPRSGLIYDLLLLIHGYYSGATEIPAKSFGLDHSSP
jgi:hypothetical protein